MRFFSGYDKAILAAIAVVIIFLSFALYLSKQGLEGYDDATKDRYEASYTVKIEKEKSFVGALESDPVAYYTKVLAWATIALAGFTVVLATVTILIWLDGKSSSSKQHEASRRALDHAARNTDAAIKATEAAVKAASATEKQLFASIASRLPVLRFGVPDLVATDSLVENEGPWISVPIYNRPPKLSAVRSIRLTNAGKTQADLQVFYFGWVVGGYEIKARYGHTIYEMPPLDPDKSEEVDCGPFNIVLTDEAISAINTSDALLRFFCRLEYVDFVGNWWVETAAWKWVDVDRGGIYGFERDYKAPYFYNQKKRIWQPRGAKRDRVKDTMKTV